MATVGCASSASWRRPRGPSRSRAGRLSWRTTPPDRRRCLHKPHDRNREVAGGRNGIGDVTDGTHQLAAEQRARIGSWREEASADTLDSGGDVGEETYPPRAVSLRAANDMGSERKRRLDVGGLPATRDA